MRAEIEARSEDVPCRDCQKPTTATVLYRPRSVGEDGGVEYDRRVPPVMCDACAADDEAAQELGRPSAPLIADPLDWLASLGVNTPKHGHATLESFDATDAPHAVRNAQRFIDDVLSAGRHDRVRSLYLVGPTGTGKSHLAVAIMRAIHEARPSMSVMYDPSDRLVTRVQDSYGSSTTDALIEQRKRAGLYVLDDLGREKATSDALRVLCTVLDEREGSPTVITSNLDWTGLGERAVDDETWARVGSRLGDEVYNYVAIDGRDRRLSA